MRTFLMILIIMSHIIIHGLGTTEIDHTSFTSADRFHYFKLVMIPFAHVAVSCFIITSGYFGIKRKPQNILHLVFQGFVYAAIASALLKIIHAPTAHCGPLDYWFLKAYLFLAICAPFINISLSHLSNKSTIQLCLILFFVDSIFAILHPEDNTYGVNMGFSIFHFIFLYIAGSTIRRFPIPNKPYLFAAGYFTFSMISAFILVILHRAGLGAKAYRFYMANSPFIQAASISLFLFFKNFPWQIRLPSILTSHLFGVYLLHDNPWIRKFFFHTVIPEHIDQSQAYFPLQIIGIAAFVLIICSPICVIVILISP